MTDWLPKAFNDGWAYRDRPAAAAPSAACFYAAQYPHSGLEVWQQRLAAGEIWRNGQQLWGDVALAAGDRLVWHRPPWQEAAVPVLPGPLFDDGDLVVFNKPSGLQVLPAGGLVRHTLLGQLEDQVAGAPRPVHRLGRFTSGLLVCARSSAARAHLSAQLRDSTAAVQLRHRQELLDSSKDQATAPLQKSATSRATLPKHANKVYRALLMPPLEGSPLHGLAVGQSITIDTPIGRQPHAPLGSLWCAVAPAPDALTASSRFSLLQVRADGWLVAVAIATGRPHQIRIHAAAAGAPLLGDPLYLPGGQARSGALPGDGGYQLHAHRIRLKTLQGEQLDLEAAVPQLLQTQGDAAAGTKSLRMPLRSC